ncbi:MAG: DinB family protein [Chloroflexi bacterium]|nr:DinB family protein [Chloroflexota bacterium]
MTTDQQIPSKAELLDALRSGEQEALAELGALSEEAFEIGRYESGWNGRQILAHFASIEWTYPRLLDVAKQAAVESESPPASDSAIDAGADAAASQPEAKRPAGRMQGGIDGYNQRQVDKRAQASVAELLEEFKRNRAATIAAVESADESLLLTPITSAGGISGALTQVIMAVAVLHVRGHVNDIVGSS